MKTNTIYTADNLAVLRGMDDESVDLIYLDPPFNSKKTWRAFEGKNVVAEFKDTWSLSDVDVVWHGEIADVNPALYQVIAAAGASGGKSNMSYCIYMSIRLLEMHRILKDTGSIYFHCDPTMSHPVKMLLDSIFGIRNFRNEIIWHKYKGVKNTASNKFTTATDNILFYAKKNGAKFNVQYQPMSQSYINAEYKYRDADGRRYAKLRGRMYQQTGETRKKYLDENPGTPLQSLWTGLYLNTSSNERLNYPTQKPLALLERIIRASSNKGDIVLDPFCGCATACVAAQIHGRKWVGIDLSPLAYKLIVKRFEKQYPNLTKPIKVNHSTTIPKRKTAGKRSPKNIIKQKLYGMQQGICKGCNTLYPFHNFDIDHIEPVSAGGPDIDSNKQLLCGFCNSRKGNRDMKYLLAQNRKDGIIK